MLFFTVASNSTAVGAAGGWPRWSEVKAGVGALLKKRAAAMGLRRRCGGTAPVSLPFLRGPWVRISWTGGNDAISKPSTFI